jgi:preprotein translocase subunit SecA
MQVEKLFGPQSRTNQLLLQGLQFAIVDEADSVLIDEARTPLIISAESDEHYDPDIYQHALDIAGQLTEDKDFQILAGEHKLDLTGSGQRRVDAFEWPETELQTNAEQRRELVRQGLVALYLFDRDKHYLVQDGKVQIVDEYTGRLMADRSWEKGLHQLIELKEGCEVTHRKETKARISYQRFFRRYLGLAGMTGTAREVAGELWQIYRLRVVRVPTNRPLQRKRIPEQIYAAADQKWDAILQTVTAWHRQQRPILVGTRSVEASEHLSALMDAAGLPHRILNARQDQEEADIIKQAGELGRITVATNMAGRGTDIRLAEGAVELGGLHVLATERHEAGRIDRQLFGRCGRQGDPGRFQAIVSLEDELIDTYAGRIARAFTAAALRIPMRFLGRWIGNAMFNKAQRRAERQHARMRHDLLTFDDTISTSLAFTGRTE